MSVFIGSKNRSTFNAVLIILRKKIIRIKTHQDFEPINFNTLIWFVNKLLSVLFEFLYFYTLIIHRNIRVSYLNELSVFLIKSLILVCLFVI
jgi:hypothetical protein